jgi:hypothetical protein
LAAYPLFKEVTKLPILLPLSPTQDCTVRRGFTAPIRTRHDGPRPYLHPLPAATATRTGVQSASARGLECFWSTAICATFVGAG